MINSIASVVQRQTTSKISANSLANTDTVLSRLVSVLPGEWLQYRLALALRVIPLRVKDPVTLAYVTSLAVTDIVLHLLVVLLQLRLSNQLCPLSSHLPVTLVLVSESGTSFVLQAVVGVSARYTSACVLHKEP